MTGTRRPKLVRLSGLAIALALASCGGRTAADDPADLADQAAHFRTAAMQDDWANFKLFFDGFCATYDLGCTGDDQGPNRFDTDMTAAEMFSQFATPSDDPFVCGDIGMHFAPASEDVALRHRAKGADSLPAAYRQAGGGWVAQYEGAVSFWVNTDVVGVPPTTWTELLDPRYRGMIAMSDPRESGTGAATVYAAAAALGNGHLDFDAAFEYFRKLRESGNLAAGQFSNAAMERGEIPIALRYDFVGVIGGAELEAKGVHTTVQVPQDGSVWAPSAMVCNKNTRKPELARAILDYSQTDEAQLAYAEYGARPIRYVVGDLDVPASARTRWLPDAAYAKTVQIDDWISPDDLTRRWEQEVLG